MKNIRVSGDRFVDEHGRHVILHGVNLVCKDKTRNYIGNWGDDDFVRLRRWGCNVVRLGVIWDAVEPEPGMFDRHYIERLRGLIRSAHRHDLYVYLDMHQDLFAAHRDSTGGVHGDGAPAWATLTGGETFVPGELWSDAYLCNGAVQRAFDHFWNNAPGPDGAGIQDHYAMAWRFVVENLGGEPNVIGYDLMNEPFIGSGVRAVMERMIAAYARIAAERGSEAAASDIRDWAAVWTDPEAKMEALKLAGQPDVFRAIMLAMAPEMQRFEKTRLMACFNKVAHAVREADPDGILFLETNYFSNIGVPSGIEPVRNARGDRDPQQAYAPHGYDLVTDTAHVHAADRDRVSFIFESHKQTQERLGMPMLIGEWGAFELSRFAERAAVHSQRIFEQLLCSDTYWCYYYNQYPMERYSYFRGICRGYPMATAGTLLRYRYREDGRLFEMEWDEEPGIARPTVIYMPDVTAFRSDGVAITPAGDGYELAKMEGSNAGFLRVPPCHQGRRTLDIVDERRNLGHRTVIYGQ